MTETPTGAAPPPPEPPRRPDPPYRPRHAEPPPRDPLASCLIVGLKVLGGLALLVLVVGGLILGTCML